MDKLLLETRGVTKFFGRMSAVFEVDFSVSAGEIRAIIGPNGAGKSTLLKLIFGELVPDRGLVLFKGREISRLPTYVIARLGISKSYQITNVFPRLSALENVRVALQARSMTFNFWRKATYFTQFTAEAHEILKMVGLTADRGQEQELACNLSHGEQKILEMGVTLAANPEVLLLDEPTAGMSAEETSLTISLIKKLGSERHLTIILVEHKIEVVNAIAERVTVLHQGRILAEGTPKEIQNNENVRSIYYRARK